MKDFLQDLVAHTNALGILPIVRITADNGKIEMDSIANDHSVVLYASTHQPVAELDGVFGMPNLNKLDLHLKCPEYKSGASITLQHDTRNDKLVPTGLLFKNKAGDYSNNYRFMSREIVDKKLDAFEKPSIKWNIEFHPTQANIQRFKHQIAAHTEEDYFSIELKNGDITFSLGTEISHAGSFVFEPNVKGRLKSVLGFPKNSVLTVLNLNGNKTIKLSDAPGALQITVDSGIASYDYIFPANT